MIRACIEQQSLRYYIEEAKRQNKEYFEMRARDLISKEKDDMVAAVQANLLFQSLNMTREEILAKYPLNNNKTETIEEEHSEGKSSDCNIGQFGQPFMQQEMNAPPQVHSQAQQ